MKAPYRKCAYFNIYKMKNTKSGKPVFSIIRDGRKIGEIFFCRGYWMLQFRDSPFYGVWLKWLSAFVENLSAEGASHESGPQP